ncbi:MAG: hypothetical protein AMS18_04315 [Gemmatimonas sp. SG8_17]|nr:MAG: hypothetical protein AMS18_04315 [Gemmatimonas sp. SG8_17]
MGLGKRRYPILSGDRSMMERRCQLAVRTAAGKYSEERRLAAVTDAADRRPLADSGCVRPILRETVDHVNF